MKNDTKRAKIIRDDFGRFAEKKKAELHKANGSLPVPPSAFKSVTDLMSSAIVGADQVLRRADTAIRENRNLQRKMRIDPDVMGPLDQRQKAVALLEWSVTPWNAMDAASVDEAATVEALIRQNIGNVEELFRHLLEAVFYGSSAAHLTYKRDRDAAVATELGVNVMRGIAPVSWFPYHPDSLQWDAEGNLGILVTPTKRHEGTTKYGPNGGPAHMFDEVERRSMAVHTVNRQGADYRDIYEAELVYHGRGLRSILWHFWLMKQTALQAWMGHVERTGLGNRIYRYPDGNETARTELQTVADNFMAGVNVFIPRDPDNPIDAYDISLHEPNAGTVEVFSGIIDGYLSGKIKEVIIGQTALTEATATGLGSDVGTRHAETFNRLIKYDTICLAGTLNRDVVGPIYRMNFGGDRPAPRFMFNLEDVDSQQWMAGVRSFVEMGGQASQEDVRSRLGIKRPDEGEELLSMSPVEPGLEGLFRRESRAVQAFGKIIGGGDDAD